MLPSVYYNLDAGEQKVINALIDCEIEMKEEEYESLRG